MFIPGNGKWIPLAMTVNYLARPKQICVRLQTETVLIRTSTLIGMAPSVFLKLGRRTNGGEIRWLDVTFDAMC
ncbi:hypothetical protein [Marinobacter maroccanus]|uniref:hypothetical protein n=1 Tax=Marinobacter maroccanus TaxID=2055143 RepID=UPI001863E914|nr:hypothetical protein [Marinobacter maroccanus]